MPCLSSRPPPDRPPARCPRTSGAAPVLRADRASVVGEISGDPGSSAHRRAGPAAHPRRDTGLRPVPEDATSGPGTRLPRRETRYAETGSPPPRDHRFRRSAAASTRRRPRWRTCPRRVRSDPGRRAGRRPCPARPETPHRRSPDPGCGGRGPGSVAGRAGKIRARARRTSIPHRKTAEISRPVGSGAEHSRRSGSTPSPTPLSDPSRRVPGPPVPPRPTRSCPPGIPDGPRVSGLPADR